MVALPSLPYTKIQQLIPILILQSSSIMEGAGGTAGGIILIKVPIMKITVIIYLIFPKT